MLPLVHVEIDHRTQHRRMCCAILVRRKVSMGSSEHEPSRLTREYVTSRSDICYCDVVIGVQTWRHRITKLVNVDLVQRTRQDRQLYIDKISFACHHFNELIQSN